MHFFFFIFVIWCVCISSEMILLFQLICFEKIILCIPFISMNLAFSSFICRPTFLASPLNTSVNFTILWSKFHLNWTNIKFFVLGAYFIIKQKQTCKPWNWNYKLKEFLVCFSTLFYTNQAGIREPQKLNVAFVLLLPITLQSGVIAPLQPQRCKGL